jgi:hypothetical protein
MFIWIQGNEDLSQQLIDAAEQIELPTNSNNPITHMDSTNNDNNVSHRFSGPQVSAILKQVGNYNGSIISEEYTFFDNAQVILRISQLTHFKQSIKK